MEGRCTRGAENRGPFYADNRNYQGGGAGSDAEGAKENARRGGPVTTALNVQSQCPHSPS